MIVCLLALGASTFVIITYAANFRVLVQYPVDLQLSWIRVVKRGHSKSWRFTEQKTWVWDSFRAFPLMFQPILPRLAFLTQRKHVFLGVSLLQKHQVLLSVLPLVKCFPAPPTLTHARRRTAWIIRWVVFFFRHCTVNRSVVGNQQQPSEGV